MMNNIANRGRNVNEAVDAANLEEDVRLAVSNEVTKGITGL
jgi:hypothetical protein